MIIGEGLKDGERCVRSTRGRFYDIARLKSNQEEANTRRLHHAKYVTIAEKQESSSIPPIQACFNLLSAAHFDSLSCENYGFALG